RPPARARARPRRSVRRGARLLEPRERLEARGARRARSRGEDPVRGELAPASERRGARRQRFRLALRVQREDEPPGAAPKSRGARRHSARLTTSRAKIWFVY